MSPVELKNKQAVREMVLSQLVLDDVIDISSFREIRRISQMGDFVEINIDLAQINKLIAQTKK